MQLQVYFIFLVTFFTFAENSTICGSRDLKIRLSKKYTLFNFLVSTLASAFVCYIAFLKAPLPGLFIFVICVLFIFIPYFVASLLALIFLFYDNLCCCCCACCLGAEEWRVFDPENHQADLVWRNGEIIDKDKEEEEKGVDDNNMTLKERNLADIEETEPIDKDTIAVV